MVVASSQAAPHRTETAPIVAASRALVVALALVALAISSYVASPVEMYS